MIKPFNAFVVVFLFLITACNNTEQTPPFPVDKTEFKQPVTKNFEFTQADTIIWETKDPSSLKPIPTKKFDWDRLPSKEVDFGFPMPFNKEMKPQPFSLDNLPSLPFSYDSLTKVNLNIRAVALGEPEVVKAGLFLERQGATRGVKSAIDFGLPGTARAIFKDKKGMLWIGVDGHIMRYDSGNLEIYGLEQGFKNTSSTIIFEDSKGRFWVGDNRGAVTIIDFEAKILYELSSVLPVGGNYGIAEAADGKFWVSNINVGYNIIDLEEKSIYQFTQNKGLLGSFVITPFRDKDNRIWLSSDGGVNIIDLDLGKNWQYTTENGLLGAFTSSFSVDNLGRLWIAMNNGAVVLNEDRTFLTSYLTEDIFKGIRTISKVFQDSRGTFWFGSTNGLMFQIDESKGEIQRYDIANAPARSLLHIVEDNQGQIWTGMPQGGLYNIDPNTARPGNFTIEDGLNSNAVWSTLEDLKGRIWIGTYEGIDIYDPDKRTITHLGEKDGLVNDRNARLNIDTRGRIWAIGNSNGVSIIDPEKETIEHLTTQQGLETNIISGMVESSNGEFWLGGEDGELLRVDPDNSIYSYHLPTNAENIFQNNRIIKDKEGYIWVAGVGSGLQKINPTTNERVFLKAEGGLISNTVYSMTLDGEDTIWIATDLGVQSINIKTNEIESFTISEGLAANDVYAIKVYKGEVYTGTSRGLTILSPVRLADQQKTIWQAKTIGRAQGLRLLDFSENSFTFDRDGRFWAGVQGEMLTVMDEIVQDTTASVTFINGVNILDQKQQFGNPERIKEKRMLLDTIWLQNSTEFILGQSIKEDEDDFSKNGIKWKAKEGPYDLPSELSLPHTQNYLSFTYNTSNYANTDQVYYRYILEGIDKNWSRVSQETVSENYRDLPPGTYSFKVASKGFNDVWSEPASFDFTILPPWWRTWWAYLLFFFIFGAAVWSFVSYRSRWLKKENRLLEERVSHRTAQLKNKIEELKATQSQLIQSEKMASLGELTAGIAHEIQNPLNFVNNFSEVNTELIEEMQEELKNKDYEEVEALSKDIKANQEKINHHGRRADAIVKGMLQHSRSSSNEKVPSNINAIADEYLRLAYHGLRAKDKSFNATMETDFDKAIGKINIVPQDVGRVILNLITNAFHAVDERRLKEAKNEENNYKPTVWVTTKRQGDTVEVCIRDNASGIPDEVRDKIFQPFFTTKPSGQGTGLGLSLSYDIIKAQGGHIVLDTKQGVGTTFKIVLPGV